MVKKILIVILLILSICFLTACSTLNKNAGHQEDGQQSEQEQNEQNDNKESQKENDNKKEKLPSFSIDTVKQDKDSDVSFSFTSNGYTLSLQAVGLTDELYEINYESGHVKISNEYLQLTNVEEHIISYKFSKLEKEDVCGTLKIQTLVWSEVVWH